MNRFDKLRPLGLLLLRIGVGVIFIFHGFPKLFGDTEKVAQSFMALGFPRYMGSVTGIIELFCGALLIVGLFTRISGLLLAGTMLVAILKVHMGKGILAVGEYEFPMALGVACFALVTTGGGLLSLDYAIFRQKA